ncbi:MAG: hypothetical protein Q9166_007994 [cf. Caloplaca sp. 2 TL-2023]
MSPEITLYDLPSKDPNKGWSLNPWKTRLILNYKSLPYTTHWLEYPDIEPHHKSHSISPNDLTAASLMPSPYTIPTIRLPNNGPFIMDSKAIAHELETLYPSPPLHLDTPQQARIEELWPKFVQIVGPAISPKVVKNVLTERSKPYFIESREKAFGISMAELEEKGDEKAWEDVRPVLEEIAAVLREKEGPFVLGEELSYADFILVSAMHFLRRVEEGLFERFVDIDPAFERLFKACKGLVERDT